MKTLIMLMVLVNTAWAQVQEKPKESEYKGKCFKSKVCPKAPCFSIRVIEDQKSPDKQQTYLVVRNLDLNIFQTHPLESVLKEMDPIKCPKE